MGESAVYDRQRIHAKTDGKCIYCGSFLYDDWHVDHVFPRSKGGSDDFHNLVPSCRSCNARKGGITDFGYLRLLMAQSRAGKPAFYPIQTEWLKRHGFDVDAIVEQYDAPLYFETHPELLKLIREAVKGEQPNA